jgi:hypothetical protein
MDDNLLPQGKRLVSPFRMFVFDADGRHRLAIKVRQSLPRENLGAGFLRSGA